MKKEMRWFVLAAACFLLSADTVPVMELKGEDGILSGILFWIGLLGGLLCYGISVHSMRKQGKAPPGRKTGIMCFATNPLSAVADLMLLLFLVANIILIVRTEDNGLSAACLFFLLVSIYAHILLNGRVFNTFYDTRDKRSGKECPRSNVWCHKIFYRKKHIHTVQPQDGDHEPGVTPGPSSQTGAGPEREGGHGGGNEKNG